MATFRTRNRMEAIRFCRDLVARGFKRMPAVHNIADANLHFNTFRTYVDFDGFYRVAYFESRTGPHKDVPKVPETIYTSRAGHCSTKGHEERPIWARGLCNVCYNRWNYWRNAAKRKAERERSRAGRAQRAAMSEDERRQA